MRWAGKNLISLTGQGAILLKGGLVVIRGRIYAFAAVATLLLLFQNCNHDADIQPANDPVVVKIGADTLAFAALSPSDQVNLCHESQYVCVERIFAPDLPYGSSAGRSCLTVQLDSGPRNVCFSFSQFTYDTTTALAACPDCTAKDAEPGGRYNYREVQCYHPDLRTAISGSFSISMETTDVATALPQAVELCGKAGAL